MRLRSGFAFDKILSMKSIVFVLAVLFAAAEAEAVHRSFINGYPLSAARARGTKAQGLRVGSGAMTPMEARLEQLRGNADAKSERIGNAQKAGRNIRNAVPGAERTPDGEKVRYVRVSKKCPCEKQTVTATGGGKVGVGKTAAEARKDASGPRATNKASW